MANEFVTVLDKVGEGIKWFFTNKTATVIEQEGLAIGEIAFPAVTPLLSAIQKSIATAQGLAANVPAGLTTAQMVALVISDAEAAFSEYETTTGTAIETAQQQAIIAAFVALLGNIPGAAVTTPVAATTSTAGAANAAAGTLL